MLLQGSTELVPLMVPARREILASATVPRTKIRIHLGRSAHAAVSHLPGVMVATQATALVEPGVSAPMVYETGSSLGAEPRRRRHPQAQDPC